MKNNLLPDVIAFLDWYKTVYGNEIYSDYSFDVSSLASILNEEPLQTPIEIPVKSEMPAVALKDEALIHQDNPELKNFYHQINKCTKCALGLTRKNFVFGMGNPNAEIMFIGEAPGQDEDIKGLPFVGKAGRLLDKMLFALGMKRDEVYIANVLKCRPPNNRDPLPDEVLHCEPYLAEQIKIIKPKVIVALGRIAAQVLLKNDESLGNLRHTEHSYEKIPFIVTYHPAALLRNPGWKTKAWSDLKKIKKYLMQ